MKNLKENAGELRKNMTDQERKIWNIIRSRQFYGYRFLRQYVVGNYIVDFICREKNIVIEIDGGQHNQKSDIEYDNARTNYLNSRGYKVIRFWNNEIDNDLTGVFYKLKEIFKINA